MSPQAPTFAERLALPLLILLAGLVLLRQIGNTALAYPDADRLLLDGVFLLDLIHQFPHWTPEDIYRYTTEYFAQYPGLSIGYKPIFLPFIEAISNQIFGVSQASSRLALFAFACTGLYAWFKLVQRFYGTTTAFWSGALLITAPAVAQWGWYTMTELPTLSMVLLTAYLFVRYIDTKRFVLLLATAIVFALACWTKQVAIFMAIWLVLYAAASRMLVPMLRQRTTWYAIGVAMLLLVPLLVVTLWLGDLNIKQSLGRTAQNFSNVTSALAPEQSDPSKESTTPQSSAGAETAPTPPHAGPASANLGSSAGQAPPEAPLGNAPSRQGSGDRGFVNQLLVNPFKRLYSDGLPVVTLAFAVLGIVLLAILRDRRAVPFLLLAVSVYLFFGLLLGIGRSRDLIYWLPAFCLFAVLPFHYLQERYPRIASRITPAILGLVVIGQVWLVFSKQPSYSRGYKLAADYVANATTSPTVFFDGYNNGYFTYFVRLADPQRNLYVLRGDKLLSSSGMYGGTQALDAKALANDVADIDALIDRFGVQFIVVESKSPVSLPIHDKLREHLRDERFRLRLSIPIDTNREPLQGQSLLVFENLQVKHPQNGMLTLDVPIVGKTISVPFTPPASRTSPEPDAP